MDLRMPWLRAESSLDQEVAIAFKWFVTRTSFNDCMFITHVLDLLEFT